MPNDYTKPLSAADIETAGGTTNTGTQTLTNKTLTAPKLANGGFIADANGNEGLILVTTASAVNEVTLTPAATGNAPKLAASGGDTNINLQLAGKGSGGVAPQGTGGTGHFLKQNTLNGVITSEVPSATDSTKLPLAGGVMTGYLELGGGTAFNGAKVGLIYASSMPHLQNTTTYVRVNAAYVEVNKGIYFSGQASGTGATEIFSDASNNLVHYAVTTKSNRIQCATTAVAGATFVTIASVSGIAQGQIFAVVTGMGSIIMDWDGTTLTKLAGATTLVVAGSAGGTEVAFRVSGGNLQASNGTGASKNVGCPAIHLQ